MDIGTLMAIEFVLFFGGFIAFGFYQLHSLKRLQQRAAARQADAGAETPAANAIPGWMARR